MAEMVSSFTGQYDFLSNYYPSDIPVQVGSRTLMAHTVEHAYQSEKTNFTSQKLIILNTKHPASATKLGKSVIVRDGWNDNVKQDVMYKYLLLKFSDPVLKEKLLATGDLYLTNTHWNDTFWGVCNGKVDLVGDV